MIAIGSGLKEEKLIESSGSFLVFWVLLVFFAVGAAIPLVVWGLWYLFLGSVPVFLGISRLWLDSISTPFYVLSVVWYIGFVTCECDKISAEDDFEEFPVYFWEFVGRRPWLSLLGLFLVLDFIASIAWSFATGLAAIVVLAIVYGLWSWIKFIVFCLFQFLGSIFGYEPEKIEESED